MIRQGRVMEIHEEPQLMWNSWRQSSSSVEDGGDGRMTVGSSRGREGFEKKSLRKFT
jgi:hypothetical protein